MKNTEASLLKEYEQCEAQLQWVVSETEALALLTIMSWINHKIYAIMQGDNTIATKAYD